MSKNHGAIGPGIDNPNWRKLVNKKRKKRDMGKQSRKLNRRKK